jgi:HK97 family phage prohead protease
MATEIEADFGGWATKAGLKCTDGRTIMRGAFEHMDQKRVPLVWQHGHSDPENILGHAILEHRDEGVYAYGFFNSTKQGENAKSLVKHKDVSSLSIYANQLIEKSKNVMHGVIHEVSLVLAGANPGAKIDYVAIRHGDGSIDELEDEAIIHSGFELEHALDEEGDEGDESEESDNNDDSELNEEETVESSDENDGSSDEGGDGTAQHSVISHALAADATVKDVYDSFSPEQQDILHYFIGVALDKKAAKDAQHSALIHNEGGDDMSRNVFDQSDDTKKGGSLKHTLTKDDVRGIVKKMEKVGSLKEAVEDYALQHGITDIDVLFPDAKAATGVVELEKRRTEWVASVLNGTRHTPFSRIKTFTADLTQDDARAKGYIKGNYKIEEWFGVTKRTTGPTTIYKKQKLDRDDMLDITDFDIVAFLKTEMRIMTEEEIARAILIGDGRDVTDEDKVKDPLGAADGTGVRSIYNDHELFVTEVNVNVDDADPTGRGYEEVIDAVMDGMEYYKGTGSPTFYTTVPQLNKFLKSRDGQGRRYYANKQEVADALGVKDIQLVEPMKEISDLIGIVVNLDDYNVGTDRGGELTMFDDFDIDYNQQKYLLETRMSGALVRPKSALIIKKTAADSVQVEPVEPGFNATTGVVTIPTVTGVVYKNSSGTTLTAGAQTALAAGASTTVYAQPTTGYNFEINSDSSWEFTRKSS